MQDSLTVLIINKEELNGLNIANSMFVHRSKNRILFLIEFTYAEYNYINSALCQGVISRTKPPNSNTLPELNGLSFNNQIPPPPKYVLDHPDTTPSDTIVF
ncbi:hypothetical protein CDAR_427071 [Caerostris darwini]|uniref:Uncharacterized protein n=1 Tax=Caerostris darwini TaxID=1538125 RepID=A0AAV4R6V7_9ARAC|nr:hypothetical protein CDAR_427071 [Caerostris darwini]